MSVEIRLIKQSVTILMYNSSIYSYEIQICRFGDKRLAEKVKTPIF